VSAFFNFAAAEGLRLAQDNPAQGIEFYPERPRERFLTADEFRRLGAALTTAEERGLPPAPSHRRKPPSEATRKHTPKSAVEPIPANPFAVAAIRLLAMTGCREGEILSLRWSAVDLDNGYLRLADTKTGKSLRPLGAAAAAVLRDLPRLGDHPFVLPGAKPNDHLKDIKRLWHAVRIEAKLEGLRLHDLRHSFASVPASGGESLLIIRAMLGHARTATTERYAHLGADPVRRAADRAAADIGAWLSGSRVEVVPLLPNHG
jgi:integrase